MEDQARWSAGTLPDLDIAGARVVRLHRSKLEGVRVLARQLGASIVEFHRELERGRAVMRGLQPSSTGAHHHGRAKVQTRDRS